MTNILFEEFIGDLLLLGEKAAAPTSHNPGDVWNTKGGFGAMNPSKNIEYFKDRKIARAYALGKIRGNKEKNVDTRKGRQGVQKNRPTGGVTQKPTAKQKSSVTNIPALAGPAARAGVGAIHDKLSTLLSKKDSVGLSALIQKYQIVYDRRKDTFYVLNVTGRQEKKIFGDAGGKGAAAQKRRAEQRALYDQLISMGVPVNDRNTYKDPLRPEAIVPFTRSKNSPRRLFNGERIGNTITFDGVTYSKIPPDNFQISPNTKKWLNSIAKRGEERPTDFAIYIKQTVNDWANNFTETNGRPPTKNEIDEAKRQIVLISDSIHKRFKALEDLMQVSKNNQSPHEVAVYDGSADGARQFIASVGKSLVNTIAVRSGKNNAQLRKQIKSHLVAIDSATDNDTAIEAIKKFYKFVEDTPQFKASAAAVAESCSIMLELKRGRKVIIPMSDQFKGVDLISLTTGAVAQEPTDVSKLTLNELNDRIKLLYSGVSVKRDVGAASSMTAKWKLCTYGPNHRETYDQLIKLSSGHSEFWIPTKVEEKTNTVTEIINKNMDLIKKYYGLSAEVSTVEQLVDILGTGGVVCGADGTPVPRPTPTFMQHPDANETAYKWTHLAQLSAIAIGNSKVISQGYGNHYWGGKAGFIEVDGIQRQIKQVPETNKAQRVSRYGRMPDYMVSHNVIPTSDEDLRSGDPCRKG